MSGAQSTRSRPGAVSRALAQDRLGLPAVLFFVLAGVAPLTVAAGVIPTAYATTGLTAIPAAFLVVGVVLAVFAAGYMAMARRITNAGAFYAFVTRGLGRPAGVAAAMIALAAYTCLQTGLYGALGPAAAAEAAAHLGVHAPWWAWALAAWAVVTMLGLLRVDIAGRVLGVLLTTEVVVIIAETIDGLAHPAGGRLSLATLNPAELARGGLGTFGVLAVVAVLGFVGFEQAPVLGEEARRPQRTIPAATYLALGVIAVVYAGAAWAMAAHAGDDRVVTAAGQLGPGLMFSLGGGALSQAAQLLFVTSLFAAALSFHNTTWRYMFALGRENVLPAALGRTSGNNIPRAASLCQSATGLIVIVAYALTREDPMAVLFFWFGVTGGLGVVVLLTVTSVAVIAYFARHRQDDETIWRRLIAPALAAVLLGAIVVLALAHYATLLGVAPGDPAAWALPASFYGLPALYGLAWALRLRARHPGVYATIGLGAHAVTAQHVTSAPQGSR